LTAAEAKLTEYRSALTRLAATLVSAPRVSEEEMLVELESLLPERDAVKRPFLASVAADVKNARDAEELVGALDGVVISLRPGFPEELRLADEDGDFRTLFFTETATFDELIREIVGATGASNVGRIDRITL
jgi:hypothetical protein